MTVLDVKGVSIRRSPRELKLNYLLGMTSLTRVLFNQKIQFWNTIFSCPDRWDLFLNERISDVWQLFTV